MPSQHILRGKDGHAVILTVADTVVITGEGSDHVVQRFPSIEAANQHVRSLIEHRKREGDVVEEQREVTALDVARITDQLPDFVTMLVVGSELRFTFHRPNTVPSLCTLVADRIERHQPTSVYVSSSELTTPGQALGKALARRVMSCVRAFVFDVPSETVVSQRKNSFGKLSDVLTAFPNLERAFVTGNVGLRAGRHEQLRELYLRGDPITVTTVKALGRCVFPRLGVLGVLLSAGESAVSDTDVATALQNMVAPLLGSVHVSALRDVTRFVDALTAARPVPPWSTLCLDGGVKNDRDLVAVVRERAPKFRAITHFGLPLRNGVSPEAEAELRTLIRGVVDCRSLPNLVASTVHENW